MAEYIPLEQVFLFYHNNLEIISRRIDDVDSTDSSKFISKYIFIEGKVAQVNNS